METEITALVICSAVYAIFTFLYAVMVILFWKTLREEKRNRHDK